MVVLSIIRCYPPAFARNQRAIGETVSKRVSARARSGSPTAMFIGVGTLVVILIIVLIVLALRRA